MSDIDEKLRRGFALIERSNGDSDLLGVALLAIHGALEDHFRATLSARSDLTPQERELLDQRSVGWLPLVNLMQKYYGLDRDQRRIILDVNDLRQQFAHGDSFNGRVSSLLRYCRFVEELCGRQGLLDQVLMEQYRARRSAALDDEDDEEPAGEVQPRWRERAYRPAAGISLGSFLVLAALIIALLLGAWLYSQPDLRSRLDLRRLLAALSILPPQSVAPGPTIAPPVTPTPPMARIVGLSGAPGWLHDAPSFASGTLPIPLSEGMPVMLREQEQTDANGTLWRYVSVGGYDGWCPANNLEPVP